MYGTASWQVELQHIRHWIDQHARVLRTRCAGTKCNVENLTVQAGAKQAQAPRRAGPGSGNAVGDRQPVQGKGSFWA